MYALRRTLRPTGIPSRKVPKVDLSDSLKVVQKNSSFDQELPSTGNSISATLPLTTPPFFSRTLVQFLIMTSQLFSLMFLASSTLASVALRQANTISTAAKTAYFPLNLHYGASRKVSANVVNPSTNTTIEVVYDQGSENFLLFGPDSISNW